MRRFTKAIAPAALSTTAVLIQWAATGAYDGPELATQLTGLLGAAVTYYVRNEG